MENRTEGIYDISEEIGVMEKITTRTTRGKVIAIERKKYIPEDSPPPTIDGLEFTIQNERGKGTAKFPRALDFIGRDVPTLILNQEINYIFMEKLYQTEGFSVSYNYSLEVLSGELKGEKYTVEE